MDGSELKCYNRPTESKIVLSCKRVWLRNTRRNNTPLLLPADKKRKKVLTLFGEINLLLFLILIFFCRTFL